MHQLRKILVPIDFSTCSRVALDRAAELAKSFGASVDLLHVWEAPAFVAPEAMVGVAGSSQTLSQLAREHAENAMRDFVSAAKEEGVNIGTSFVEQGDAAKTIVELADREGYDLIALGTHGRTGLAHLLLGSVAEKVVRRSSRPVLTVRERAESS
ncbi:MAG: universal stress protein [Myxococcales bacterium]|nr:universal stress protein [Myxococcales bacterium]MCB9578446.1 universal stress protein [Polyangiaceae bacterium]